MKNLIIKVICDCGEEVTERLNALDDTMILLAEAVENGEWQGIQNKVAKWIKYEEDRPAEPDPHCACCKLNHPAPYTCDHCDPNHERLDKRRSSTVC